MPLQIQRFLGGSVRKRAGFGVRIDGLDRSSHIGRDWSVTHDTEQAFSSGTLPIVTNLSLGPGLHTVAVYSGWSGNYDLAYVGEVVGESAGYFPAGSSITLAGYFHRTQEGLDRNRAYYYSGGTQAETNSLLADIAAAGFYQAIPILTDADIIINILEAYNITPGTTGHRIEASAHVGCKISPIYWDYGTPGYTIIRDLDETADYRTYDARGGEVRRRRLYGSVPSPRYTFVQATSILDLSESTMFAVYNQVVCKGAQDQSSGLQIQGLSPVGGPVPSPYIPTPPGVRTYAQTNSALLETVLECQALADAQLGRLSQPLPARTLTVPACADMDAGDGLAITAGRFGLAAVPHFAVSHTLTLEQSVFALRGSSEAAARPNQPPTAAMVVTLVREQVLIAGVLTPVVVVTVDATGSSDSDGTIAAYSITIGGGTAFTTPTATKLYTGASPVTITVTVTDNGGLSDTLTRSYPLDATTLIHEGLAAAELTRGEATDDEITWRALTAAATAVAPITTGGAVCYGCSDGKLYRTLDKLATAPTLATTFGSAVNCLWNNETTPARWLAGLQSGEVWLSIDSAVTWSKLYTFAAAVNDLSESPAAIGEMQACSGASLWHTFDGRTWTADLTGNTGAVALRLAAGFDRRWVGYSDGRVLGISTVDGAQTALTLPVVAAVRGLTLKQTSEALYIFTDTTAAYIWTAAGGLVAGPATGTATNRAIRSTLGDFAYLATDGALQKWLATGTSYDIRLSPSGGRFLAAGYLSAAAIPTSVGSVLMPTYNQPTSGVWVYANGAWTLKSAGLPANMYWTFIAVDPFDNRRWALLGNKGVAASGLDSEPGYFVDIVGGTLRCKDRVTHPLWITTDAGATWAALPIPMPTADSVRRLDHVEWSETTAGTLTLAAIRFNFYSTYVWRGTTAGLTRYFPSQPTNIATELLAWCNGAGDEVVIYGNYAMAYYNAALTAVTLTTTSPPPFNDVNRVPTLDRVPGPARQLALADKDIPRTVTFADYRTFSYAVNAATTGFRNMSLSVGNGYAYVGSDGYGSAANGQSWHQLASNGAGAETTLITLPIGQSIGYIRHVRGQRATTTLVAARLSGGDAGTPADCFTYDGVAVVRIPGPTGVTQPMVANMIEVLA